MCLILGLIFTIYIGVYLIYMLFYPDAQAPFYDVKT